jgi:hypothetical protein
MRKIAVAVGLFALTALQVATAHEIYSTVGTEGIGLGYGYSLGAAADVRADFNFFRLSHSGNIGEFQYDGTAQLAHAGLYADWYPLGATSRFRLTVGALIGNDSIRAEVGPPGGVIQVDHYSVPTNGQTIHAKTTLPTVRPYIGIGYGHDAVKNGFSFVADVGVAYGSPTVTYEVPAELRAYDPNYGASEESKWQNIAKRVRFYPIVKVGVSYTF